MKHTSPRLESKGIVWARLGLDRVLIMPDYINNTEIVFPVKLLPAFRSYYNNLTLDIKNKYNAYYVVPQNYNTYPHLEFTVLSVDLSIEKACPDIFTIRGKCVNVQDDNYTIEISGNRFITIQADNTETMIMGLNYEILAERVSDYLIGDYVNEI